jgi:uncharacterized protein
MVGGTAQHLTLHLTVTSQTLSVCRQSTDAPWPRWVGMGPFVSLTRTDDEFSIVCASDLVPADFDGTVESGWRCFKFHGPFAFTLTGVLAAALTPLSEAGVGIFAISTFDTDYLLVKAEQLEPAINALRAAGHTVDDAD